MFHLFIRSIVQSYNPTVVGVGAFSKSSLSASAAFPSRSFDIAIFSCKSTHQLDWGTCHLATWSCLHCLYLHQDMGQFVVIMHLIEPSCFQGCVSIWHRILIGIRTIVLVIDSAFLLLNSRLGSCDLIIRSLYEVILGYSVTIPPVLVLLPVTPCRISHNCILLGIEFLKWKKWGVCCLFFFVSIWNGLDWSGIITTGSSVNRFFSSSNACWQSSVHPNFWSFFNRSFNGFTSSEKCQIKRQ